MSDSQIPIARREGLVIQELPGEVLVYDLETNKAHCLNRTAAAVWKSCDGKNSVRDISDLIADTEGSSVEEDLVWLAIEQLSENNLLENKPPVNFNHQNRREVIRKIGLAARGAAGRNFANRSESGAGGKHTRRRRVCFRDGLPRRMYKM